MRILTSLAHGVVLAIALLQFAVAAAATVPHVDTVYAPLVLGKSGSGPSSGQVLPDVVREHCTADKAVTTYGGGVLVPILASWFGKLITGGVQKWIDSRIAEYSTVNTSDSYFGAFDDAGNWIASVNGEATGCFLVVQRACDVDADAENPRCPEDLAPRLTFVGEYKRAATYLQARALYGSVSGFVTKYQKGKSASIALTLKVGATWVHEDLGHTASLFDLPLYSEKYVADEKVHVLKIKAKDWADLKPLPLPPPSKGSSAHGVTTIEVAIAEAAATPAALRAFKKFLDDKGDDVAGVLADALKKLAGEGK